MGYFMGDQFSPDLIEGLFSNIPNPVESTYFGMFTALLINNVTAGFVFIITGFLLGIPSLLLIILNGFITGFVGYLAAKEMSIAVVFLLLLPHGVIEFPAISLSAAMGVGIGFKVINRLRNERGVRSYFVESIRIFVTRIIPSLILAAAIETVLIYFIVG
jgi:stage II sporulation protein M